MNTSIVSDDKTARTNPECADQRAYNIYTKGLRSSILELCVGPSLEVMEKAYASYGIRCVGNDIQERWKKYYPKGDWVIGDALTIEWNSQWVVFAPPLSRGCSGKREDSLSIYEVNPGYFNFIDRLSSERRNGVVVLPARSLSTKQDRTEFFHLMNYIAKKGFISELNELTAGKRKIRKYVDIYLTRR